MNRLLAATEKVNERSAAAAGMPAGASAEVAGILIEHHKVRAMYLGTSITQEEVDEYTNAAWMNMQAMVRSGVPIQSIIAGYLNHAILTGLLAAAPGDE